jgi:predicted DNA-binding transcriptional regulator AlpA
MNIIRFKELSKLLGGISRSSIDRWEKNKSFPKRIKLGLNSIGWNLEEVIQWIENKS